MIWKITGMSSAIPATHAIECAVRTSGFPRGHVASAYPPLQRKVANARSEFSNLRERKWLRRTYFAAQSTPCSAFTCIRTAWRLTKQRAETGPHTPMTSSGIRRLSRGRFDVPIGTCAHAPSAPAMWRWCLIPQHPIRCSSLMTLWPSSIRRSSRHVTAADARWYAVAGALSSSKTFREVWSELPGVCEHLNHMSAFAIAWGQAP